MFHVIVITGRKLIVTPERIGLFCLTDFWTRKCLMTSDWTRRQVAENLVTSSFRVRQQGSKNKQIKQRDEHSQLKLRGKCTVRHFVTTFIWTPVKNYVIIELHSNTLPTSQIQLTDWTYRNVLQESLQDTSTYKFKKTKSKWNDFFSLKLIQC